MQLFHNSWNEGVFNSTKFECKSIRKKSGYKDYLMYIVKTISKSNRNRKKKHLKVHLPFNKSVEKNVAKVFLLFIRQIFSTNI